MNKLILFLFILILSLPAWAQRKLVFIVNELNPINSLSTHQISDMFLKKNRSWSTGEAVRVFDRRDGSAERKLFLSHVMKRSSREMDQYWIGQKLYTGNSAPSQLSSDNMVMALVSRFPGAISYVLDVNYKDKKGIKKIEVSDAP